MNFKALIKAEDLHAKILKIDMQVATIHKVLKDLTENDGHKLSLNITKPVVDQPPVKNDFLSQFMQQRNLTDFMVVDHRGEVVEQQSLKGLLGAHSAPVIPDAFELTNRTAIIFMQLYLQDLTNSREHILKMLEEAVAAMTKKIS